MRSRRVLRASLAIVLSCSCGGSEPVLSPATYVAANADSPMAQLSLEGGEGAAQVTLVDSGCPLTFTRHDASYYFFSSDPVACQVRDGSTITVDKGYLWHDVGDEAVSVRMRFCGESSWGVRACFLFTSTPLTCESLP